MADEPDVSGSEPAAGLTVDCDRGVLRCAGTLDSRTRRQVVDALDELLATRPAFIVVDVGELHVADVDGANTLAAVQRSAREAGVRLRWQGLDSGQLRGLLPLRFRARRPRPQTGLRTVTTLRAARSPGVAVHPSAMSPINQAISRWEATPEHGGFPSEHAAADGDPAFDPSHGGSAPRGGG